MLKQLAGQTAVYGVSTIVSRLLNYLLVPYLSRVLTTAEYGVNTYMYSLIPFALVLLTMGLETGYFRFAGEAKDVESKQKIFATTWGAVSAAGILFMAAVLLFTPEFASFTGCENNPSFVVVVGGIIMFDVITAIPFARLRQEGKAKKFLVVRMFSVMVNLIFTVFFYSALPALASKGNFWAAMYDPAYGPGYIFVANLIASFLTLIFLFPAYRDTVPRINWKLLKTILIYSFPLLLSGIIGTANQFIDRQMIKELMPQTEAMEALGIYGAVIKIGTILIMFVQVYRYAAEPFFLASFKKEDFVQANAEALKYFVIVSVLIFLGITLYEDLFALLVGPEFRPGMVILPIILLAYIFSGMTLNFNFWYKKTEKTSYALWITCIGLFFTVVLNILLIPSMGYVGSAWARLGCETVMLVVSYYLNHKFYPTPYNIPRICLYFLVGAIIYATTYFTKEINIYIRYSLNAILIAGFVYFAIRKENIDVKALIKSVLRR